jgi:hypothetical protein
VATEYIGIPGSGSASWRSPVATSSLLPANGNNPGDARIAQDTGVIYVYVGTSWIAATSGGGAGVASLNGLSGPLNIIGGTNVTVTPSGSQITISSTGSGGQIAYTHTLTSADITNKYFSLPSVPSVANLTLLTVVGGPMQEYGTDYIVVGSSLTWSGLFLDGVLNAGDVLIAEYE